MKTEGSEFECDQTPRLLTENYRENSTAASKYSTSTTNRSFGKGFNTSAHFSSFMAGSSNDEYKSNQKEFTTQNSIDKKASLSVER